MPRVVVSKLGTLVVSRGLVPSEYLKPLLPPPTSLSSDGEPVRTAVQELRVKASVGQMTVGQGGHQTIHVFVIDQRGVPVPDVFAVARVHYPELEMPLDVGPTDGAGYAAVEFELDKMSPGVRVIVDVEVDNGGLVGRAQTFFLPWW